MRNDHRGSRAHLLPFTGRLSRMPLWLLFAILLAILFLWMVANNGDYRIIFVATARGLDTTITVSIIAYVAAMLLGLAVGLLRISRNRLLLEVTSFYVEIVRGVPMLVLLYYIAFVGAPAVVTAVNWLGGPLIEAGVIQPLNVRQLDFTVRAVLALTIGYSAFISEIFRAGIQSIPRGQMEAALAVGMTHAQAMRRIILPQAVRNVLPPLGNEFVAMLKDSALVSVLGVQDITQLGKVYSASTFKFFETYNTVAFLYLVMTVTLSLGVAALERRLSQHKT
ncbi:MAG: amino acid ABC transporter permease [Anaerolineae bacterium]|nr:amino acid ABC transporter permease [Anaerolineae bacterium]MDX9829633.1 amino acid ABC transporter permease [Anaerolineae bacterium]